MIEVSNLTKRFGNGKGIFDVSFHVEKGEVFGFIGPNGAGKSTTIRHLMGFLHADRGTARIGGRDCWREPERVKEKVGYLPGEIAFPAGLCAREFLDLQAGLRGVQDHKKMHDLVDRFHLDLSVPVKRMSKGMKQKLAIVAAFMGDPDVLLLDEASTGLDPLMQKELIALFEEEKRRGTTIFLSSHIFTEIEHVADTVCMIKNGRIVENEKFAQIRERLKPILHVTLKDPGEKEKLHIPFKDLGGGTVGIEFEGNANEVIRALAQCDIEYLDVRRVTLDALFEKYYLTGEE